MRYVVNWTIMELVIVDFYRGFHWEPRDGIGEPANHTNINPSRGYAGNI